MGNREWQRVVEGRKKMTARNRGKEEGRQELWVAAGCGDSGSGNHQWHGVGGGRLEALYEGVERWWCSGEVEKRRNVVRMGKKKEEKRRKKNKKGRVTVGVLGGDRRQPAYGGV